MDKELEEWLSDKPEIIKNMALSLSPFLAYRIKNTGQRGTIISYSEDGTVKLFIHGHDHEMLNSLYSQIPLTVFGLKPEDLEEIREK